MLAWAGFASIYARCLAFGLVPRGEVRLGRHATVPPHVLCCQLFRWDDLQHEFELVRLPLCPMTPEDGRLYECCNPYHWARLVKPGEIVQAAHRRSYSLFTNQTKIHCLTHRF